MKSSSVFLGIFVTALTAGLGSAEEQPADAPGFNQRLDQALGSEGGVQVYQDPDGNVGTVIDPPGGDRQFNMQPPQSPSMNLGPPLQLHQTPSRVPPTVSPAAPPAQDFPQKAH